MCSLLESIRNAKNNLASVETRVTFEDGNVAIEKRSAVTGEFERADTLDETDESVAEISSAELPNSCGCLNDDGGTTAAADDNENNIDDASRCCSQVAIASRVDHQRTDLQLSNRQLKRRIRRQRLGYIVDLKPDLQMAKITEGVFLGSQDVAHDYELLKQHHITHIINCATYVKNIFEGRIKYMNIDAVDLPSMNIAQYFDECHSFMRKSIEAGGNVLVHCNAGVSRSATIVLSYLMKYENKTLKEAIDHVNAIRRVRPNDGFMQQLLIYESQLREAHQT